jgi:hypothetical protein
MKHPTVRSRAPASTIGRKHSSAALPTSIFSFVANVPQLESLARDLQCVLDQGR